MLSPSYAKKKRVRGERENAPIPRGPLVDKPKLSALESECWDRILKLAPPGFLADSDEIMVELTARLWAKVRRGKANATETNQLRICCRELGMSPGQRAPVTPEPSNEFADA